MAVTGYKSVFEEQSIELGALTIIAGPNSSGKSSIMQPALLMKQTLEAPYDPGDLLINGPNVRFSSTEQIFSKRAGVKAYTLTSQITARDLSVETDFRRRNNGKGLHISRTVYRLPRGEVVSLEPNMPEAALKAMLSASAKSEYETLSKVMKSQSELRVVRQRCFLALGVEFPKLRAGFYLLPSLEELVRDIIHVPGLRGNPERTYPVTAVDRTFPGTFENYVASVIAHWQSERNRGKLKPLVAALESLGLTSRIEAKTVSDISVELRVGRSPGEKDLVNIADVGLGVSQTLPVIVALLVARPGQMVYLEQPEIHLHPRAQYNLAEILVRAANSGVRVVVETHSALLIRGIQTQVARSLIDAKEVRLHWFSRRPEDGATVVTSTGLDRTGAYGQWPADLDDIMLNAEQEYLNAAFEAAHKG